MDKNLLADFQNRAFQAKTKDEWTKVLTEAKQACEGDINAYNYLKNYFTKILPKKREYWEKFPPKEKKQFPIKSSFIFQENLANALTEYLQLMIIEKKQQLNIK